MVSPTLSACTAALLRVAQAPLSIPAVAQLLATTPDALRELLPQLHAVISCDERERLTLRAAAGQTLNALLAGVDWAAYHTRLGQWCFPIIGMPAAVWSDTGTALDAERHAYAQQYGVWHMLHGYTPLEGVRILLSPVYLQYAWRTAHMTRDVAAAVARVKEHQRLPDLWQLCVLQCLLQHASHGHAATSDTKIAIQPAALFLGFLGSLAHSGQYADAIVTLETLIPDDLLNQSTGQRIIVEAMCQGGVPEQAVALIRAIAYKDEQVNAIEVFVTTVIAMQKPHRLVVDVLHLIDRPADQHEMLTTVILAYVRVHKLSFALELLKSIKHTEQQYAILEKIGKYYISAGKYGVAKKIIAPAKLTKHYDYVLQAMIKTYGERKQYTEAYALVEQIQDSFIQGIAVQNLLEIQAARGFVDRQAHLYLDTCIDADQRGMIIRALALAYANVGSDQEALALVTMHPRDQRQLTLRAEVLKELVLHHHFSDLDAVVQLERLLGATDDVFLNHEIRTSIGVIYALLGQFTLCCALIEAIPNEFDRLILVKEIGRTLAFSGHLTAALAWAAAAPSSEQGAMVGTVALQYAHAADDAMAAGLIESIDPRHLRYEYLYQLHNLWYTQGKIGAIQESMLRVWDTIPDGDIDTLITTIHLFEPLIQCMPQLGHAVLQSIQFINTWTAQL